MVIHLVGHHALAFGHIVQHVVDPAQVDPVVLGPSRLVVRRHDCIRTEQVGGKTQGAHVGIGITPRDGGFRRYHPLDKACGIELQVILRLPELLAADFVIRASGKEVRAGCHGKCPCRQQHCIQYFFHRSHSAKK